MVEKIDFFLYPVYLTLGMIHTTFSFIRHISFSPAFSHTPPFFLAIAGHNAI